MAVIFNKNLHQDFSVEGRSKQLLSSSKMKKGKFQSMLAEIAGSLHQNMWDKWDS